MNREIRAKQVRVKDNDGKLLGVFDTYKAIRMAEDQALDLVQIALPGKDGIAVCQITDYGKFKYETSKKEKEMLKKQRENIVKTKEIKFKSSTDIHDIEVKANMASKFLEEGCRVKIKITFCGRDGKGALRNFMPDETHLSFGKEKMNQFLSLVGQFNLIDNPKLEGTSLVSTIG